ncbi:FG-GAP-like repeat-containing protein [Sorangium sp. So ce118]
MQSNTIKILGTPMLLFFVAACSGADDFESWEEDIASSEDAIRFGTYEDPFGTISTSTSAKSVVAVPGCSATIIDPEWVLTAKHCGLAVGARAMSVRSSGNVTRTVDRVIHHASLDVTLGHLSTPFLDVPRMSLYDDTTASISGKTVKAYGFGSVEMGVECTSNAQCSGGEHCNSNWKRCMLPTSEAPLRSALLTVSSAGSATLALAANSIGQTTLPGDSGGPSFYGTTGTKVVGVHSTGNGTAAWDVAVPDFRDWALTSMNRTSSLWSGTFSDANGWDLASSYVTLDYPDVNNDGRADVCGRAAAGIVCATSNGATFGAATTWQSSYSDANGWKESKYYSTIRFPDLNNDGRADVCGRGDSGIWCAISSGIGFGTSTQWEGSFSDSNGWSTMNYYSTISFPDVNADGRADVCGRGNRGIICATSTGAGFTGGAIWSSVFSDSNGWTQPKYYSTIRFADVNADGRDDVCGRGSDGVWCAVSTGTSFGTATKWSTNFTDAYGWDTLEYYSTIQFADVNADGRDDVCGRGGAGVLCALSTGVSFNAVTTYSTQLQDAWGGNKPEYYRTITIKDIDNDGRADLCFRGILGVYCSPSTGSAFSNNRVWASDYSDANRWNSDARYYRTIDIVDVDGDHLADVCGRGGRGVYCAID